MAEQFIQRVPLLWLVIPLAFLVDDQLRDRLRMSRQGDGCLQLFGGHFAVAVAVDDVEQSALDRSLVFSVGHGAVAFELRFVELADVAEERGEGMSRRAVVVDDVVAFPRPGAEPWCDTDFFAHPAVEQVVVRVV
ncbi:hypothetical protein D3C72_1103330 [compost metagenome]